MGGVTSMEDRDILLCALPPEKQQHSGCEKSEALQALVFPMEHRRHRQGKRRHKFEWWVSGGEGLQGHAMSQHEHKKPRDWGGWACFFN